MLASALRTSARRLALRRAFSSTGAASSGLHLPVTNLTEDEEMLRNMVSTFAANEIAPLVSGECINHHSFMFIPWISSSGIVVLLTQLCVCVCVCVCVRACLRSRVSVAYSYLRSLAGLGEVVFFPTLHLLQIAT